MAQPIWTTTAGTIGSYPYGISMLFILNADPVIPATSVTYTLLAGSLPLNIVLNSTTGVTGSNFYPDIFACVDHNDAATPLSNELFFQQGILKFSIQV